MRQFAHNDFVIGCPDGWMDISTVILAGQPQGDFTPNITITRDRLRSPQPAAQYAADTLPALKKEFQGLGYELRQEGPISLGELIGYQRFHTFRLQGSGLQIQQWQVYAVNGSEAVTITCTDKLANFQNSFQRFQEAVRQFAFKPPG